MANKKEIQQAIDAMVKQGQRKFDTEAERRVYAYGFVCGLLTDLAMQDSVVMSKIVQKYKKTVK